MPEKSPKLYDTVRIKSFYKALPVECNTFDSRAPRVGDIACIIEIYTNPAGYELECIGQDGMTEWLRAFAPGDVEFDILG